MLSYYYHQYLLPLLYFQNSYCSSKLKISHGWTMALSPCSCSFTPLIDVFPEWHLLIRNPPCFPVAYTPHLQGLPGTSALDQHLWVCVSASASRATTTAAVSSNSTIFHFSNTVLQIVWKRAASTLRKRRQITQQDQHGRSILIITYRAVGSIFL